MLDDKDLDYQSYKAQREKWYDPEKSNVQCKKIVQLVFPDWERYEEKYNYDKKTDLFESKDSR